MLVARARSCCGNQLFITRLLAGKLSGKAELTVALQSGLPAVGVRVPSHPVALELLRQAGVPVTFYTVVGAGHGGFTDPRVSELPPAFFDATLAHHFPGVDAPALSRAWAPPTPSGCW